MYRDDRDERIAELQAQLAAERAARPRRPILTLARSIATASTALAIAGLAGIGAWWRACDAEIRARPARVDAMLHRYIDVRWTGEPVQTYCRQHDRGPGSAWYFDCDVVFTRNRTHVIVDCDESGCAEAKSRQ